MKVNLPATGRDFEAASFGTPDGRSGWVLRLPGGRPIATPAYADGMLFVGGGYGSHEFYALDSETGRVIWKIQTGDDGPTAAVVADGMVAFNTESCTLVVVEERRGRVIWQEWLGDPLMSQPAIDKGVLFMAHPAATGQVFSPPAVGRDYLYLAGADGHLVSVRQSNGGIGFSYALKAPMAFQPVLAKGNVYAGTSDGRLICLKTGNQDADGWYAWGGNAQHNKIQ